MSLYAASFSKLINRQFGNQLVKAVHIKSNFVLKNNQQKFFSISISNLSKKFTDKHEWISLNGNIGTVGITDYAQDKLGEVVYAELPVVGTQIAQADQFATLESVKAVSECYSPAAGKVVEINESIKETPSQINKSPFDQGWLIKIEVANTSEVEKLMDETQYKEFLKAEEH